jgi:hypothetical protein
MDRKTLLAHKAEIYPELEKAGLEYTAFSPGGLMNYFAIPHADSHLKQFTTILDPEEGVAILAGSGDEQLTLTSARNLAKFVVGAVGLPAAGTWPKFGGIVDRTRA